MTPEEIEAIAEELNFEIDYAPDGQMVLFTGVIDEKHREVTPLETTVMETEDEDDDDEIYDPYTT